MNDGLVAAHCRRQGIEVLDVAVHERKAAIPDMAGEMPLAAGRHVVENRDALDLRIGQQTIHEVAADESRTTRDETRHGHHWHSQVTSSFGLLERTFCPTEERGRTRDQPLDHFRGPSDPPRGMAAHYDVLQTVIPSFSKC